MMEFFIGMLAGLALGVTIGAWVAYETIDKSTQGTNK
jgi:hypothetical protein